MHELSIAMNLIDGVLEESEKRGGLRVEAVHLKIGALAGVDQGALTFSYEIACQGTALEGSRLVIEEVPVTLHCTMCGRDHTPESLLQLRCPQCETPAQDLVHGREIEITALEVAA
ncbi:MAG: hydrogenase maturation nickel metallochaperone HypA [Terriglobales bacterium]